MRKWVIAILEKSSVHTFQKDTGELFLSMCAVVAAPEPTAYHCSVGEGGGFLWGGVWVIKPQRFVETFARHTSSHLGSYFVASLKNVSQHFPVASSTGVDGFLVCSKGNCSLITNPDLCIIDCSN